MHARWQWNVIQQNASIAIFANGCYQNVENIKNPKYKYPASDMALSIRQWWPKMQYKDNVR